MTSFHSERIHNFTNKLVDESETVRYGCGNLSWLQSFRLVPITYNNKPPYRLPVPFPLKNRCKRIRLSIIKCAYTRWYITGARDLTYLISHILFLYNVSSSWVFGVFWTQHVEIHGFENSQTINLQLVKTWNSSITPEKKIVFFY